MFAGIKVLLGGIFVRESGFADFFMAVRGDGTAGSVIFRKDLVIPLSMAVMAPLAIMVVRTIFLNSLKRTIVFSLERDCHKDTLHKIRIFSCQKVIKKKVHDQNADNKL
jgi:hypothetical protein